MTRAVAALALACAVLQLAAEWIPPYELMHDELYYRTGAKHLAAGHVDHPPLEDLLRDWRHFGIDPAPLLTERAPAAD
jgi:hypothetical protein